MDLSPGLAAVLAAFLTAALSVVVQLIANHHARKTAAEDRADARVADRERREFEARESRYHDRLDAAIAFSDIAQSTANAAIRWHNDFPGERFQGPYSEVRSAYTRVVLLGTHNVPHRATLLYQSLEDTFYGQPDFAKLASRQLDYEEACHYMLREPDRPSLPTKPVA